MLVVFLEIVRKSTSASCLEKKNCFELSHIEIAEMHWLLKIIDINMRARYYLEFKQATKESS